MAHFLFSSSSSDLDARGGRRGVVTVRLRVGVKTRALAQHRLENRNRSLLKASAGGPGPVLVSDESPQRHCQWPSHATSDSDSESGPFAGWNLLRT